MIKQLDEMRKKVRSIIGFILADSQHEEESMEDKVRNVLLKIDALLGGIYYSKFLEEWYNSIYSYSKVKSVIEEKGITTLRGFNEFVQKTKIKKNN